MKIGFNLLLWTTHVTEAHAPTLEALKAQGYDGVEIPIFDGDVAHYSALARRLDALGLERTAISVIPDPALDPLSDDAGVRAAGLEHLKGRLDRAAALGAELLCGPLHQALGRFSGVARTEAEAERAVDCHSRLGDHAARVGVPVALEALNRFECYFATTVDELNAHLARVDHPMIRAMFDTFHANIEERDPVAAAARALPRLAHVHVSENDRGVVGRGHVPLSATLAVLRAGGYDGWLTVEAFGRALPELAAATRVWRDFAPTLDEIWRDSHGAVARGWAAAGD